MRTCNKHGLTLLLALGALLLSLQAMATCTLSVTAQNVTAPLVYNGSFTVGTSSNDSSQIYNQLTTSQDATFNCTRAPYFRKMIITGTLANGFSNVYETGVAGIGVKFIGMNGDSTAQLTGPYTANANTRGPVATRVHAVFMRTGEVGNGAIMGASMPVVRQYMSDADGDVLFHTLNYSGSIPIVAATCRTPDFTYNLGTFGTGTFTGVNTATAWVSTPVRLTSCSPFYGFMVGGWYSWSTTSGGGGSGQNISSNTLTMTLAPVTTVINSASGIISLDTTGATAATGIGIQLGTQSGGSYTPLNLATPLAVSPAVNDASGVVQFTLGARYIQTASTVTSGSANASVVYTITYR